MSIKSKLLFLISSTMGLFIIALSLAIVAIPKGGIIVALMLVLSLIGLVLNKEWIRLDKWEKYFLFSFIFYFSVVAINLWWFEGNLHDLDTPSRLVLVLPIYFFIRKSDIKIEWFIWGFVISAMVIAVNQIMFKFGYGGLYSFQDNPGIVTLYVSISGLICLFFISKDRNASNFLFAIVSIASIFASLLSGGRGVWIAAILTVVIVLLLNPLNWGKNAKLIVLSSFIGIIFISYFIPQTSVKDRVDMTVSNVTSWVMHGKADTSSGARLEMWKAALEVIKENPIIGVGEDNYALHQKKLIEQGRIDKFVGNFTHPHGEYITSLVEQGVIGLLAFIFVLLTPIMFFIKIIKHNSFNYRERVLATSGMLISLHYSFYSFTSGVFDHQSTTLFYAVFMVIIFGLIKSNSRTEI